MFSVLNDKLAKKINNGLIDHGYMVRDLEKAEDDSVFFENEIDAQDYINLALKADITKRMSLQEVNLQKSK